jgi:hypothetical protein
VERNKNALTVSKMRYILNAGLMFKAWLKTVVQMSHFLELLPAGIGKIPLGGYLRVRCKLFYLAYGVCADKRDVFLEVSGVAAFIRDGLQLVHEFCAGQWSQTENVVGGKVCSLESEYVGVFLHEWQNRDLALCDVRADDS